MKALCPSILLCALLSAALPLQAGVIYREDFKGSESENLDGTEPAVTTAGARWSASQMYKRDGSVSPKDFKTSASLPFIPESGKVYTLKGVLVTGPSSSRWVALGFFSDVSTKGYRHSEAGSIWILHRSGEAPNQELFLSTPAKPALLSTDLKTERLVVEFTLDATSDENVLLTVNLNGGPEEISGQDIGSLKRLGIVAVGLSDSDFSPGSFAGFELSSAD